MQCIYLSEAYKNNTLYFMYGEFWLKEFKQCVLVQKMNKQKPVWESDKH